MFILQSFEICSKNSTAMYQYRVMYFLHVLSLEIYLRKNYFTFLWRVSEQLYEMAAIKFGEPTTSSKHIKYFQQRIIQIFLFWIFLFWICFHRREIFVHFFSFLFLENFVKSFFLPISNIFSRTIVQISTELGTKYSCTTKLV